MKPVKSLSIPNGGGKKIVVPAGSAPKNDFQGLRKLAKVAKSPMEDPSLASQAYEMFRKEYEAAKGDPQKEAKFGAALAATLGSGPAMLLLERFIKNDPI